MRVIWWLILIIIFIFATIFSILNSQIVVFYYFVGQVELPLSVLVLGGFIIGGLIGLLVAFVSKCKKRK